MQTRAFPSGRIVLAAALALPLFLTACDNEGIDAPPPTIPAASPGFARDLLAGRVAVPVKVVDARTGTVLSVPVSLRVSDDDAGQDFHETNGLNSNNGLITLMLKPGVTAAGPVALRLIAQAEGYFTGGAAVELDANAGEVLIRLVSMTAGAQPEGVAVASQAGVTAAADGALQTAINLNAEAANAAANGAGTTFTLPVGTVLRDADGNALSGALTVDIAYFSPTTDESLAAFPGGFSPGTVMDAGGNPSEGYFITAGFLAVDIVDASGRKAHLLSQPASMTIQIPAGTHNPETGNAVAAGDTIPVWSHDERSGQWSHEQVATVVAAADGSGNFEVTFTVNHLSYWNLGWYSESTCDPTLNFTGITEMPKDGLFVEATSNGYFHYQDSTVFNDLSNQVRSMPTDIPITLTAFAERYGVPLGSVTATVGSTCDAIVLPIDASLLPPAPRYLDVTFMIEAPRSWKLAQLGGALTEAGLDSEEQAEILEYTHGFDASRTYVVDDAFYAKLAEVGATAVEIDRVRVFMALRIKPQNGRVAYMLSDYSIDSAELDTNGQLRIRLPEGRSAWISACYVGGYVSGTWTEVYNPACEGYENYGADPAVARVDLPATATSVTITLASTQFVVNSALAVLAEYGVDR
jgi:hypothetical protein